MTNIQKNSFHWVDYAVFALVLIISATIGLFYALRGKKTTTTQEYLMAGRDMNVIPVALSLLASFMSAITLLGTPAEIYKFGSIYWFIWIAYIILMPIAAHIFLPVFFRLKLTTVFEYLELRFNKKIRILCAIIFMVQMILYMAIVLYAPSLALNQVTGLNTWVSVFAVGIVCTFYTTIGGMKAVMWTDSFQIITMFAGLIAIIVRGSIDFGGFSEIWRINKLGGRLDFINFDPDPMQRHTFWSLTLGGTITWLAIYGVNQAQIQRALCVPKLKTAQLALWVNVIGLMGLLTVCCLCGLVIYAQYADCDPLTLKIAGTSDQLLPVYVMDRLGIYRGLPGLFTATLFSGALSTISSGLNSMSAVLLRDVLNITCLKNLTDEKNTFLAKLFVILFGGICIVLTFVAAQLGDVLAAALGLFGILGGPVLAVFLLGILYPCINKHGALSGLIVSLIVTMWCGFGAQVNKPISKTLPMNISGCEFSLLNTSQFYNNSISMSLNQTMNFKRTGFDHFYDLSYLYYGVLACLSCIIVAFPISFFTGFTKKENLNPMLLMPITDVFCCCLPEKVLNICRCYMTLYETKDGDYDINLNNEILNSCNEIAVNTFSNESFQADSNDCNFFNSKVNSL